MLLDSQRFAAFDFKGDVFGGVTTAIISLPLALAFGVASGAGAEAGLDQHAAVEKRVRCRASKVISVPQAQGANDAVHFSIGGGSWARDDSGRL